MIKDLKKLIILFICAFSSNMYSQVSENFIDSLKKNNLLLYSQIINSIKHNNKYNNYIFYYEFLNIFTDKLTPSELKIFESSIRLNSALNDMKNIPKISQAFNKILFLFFPKHNLFFL